MKTLDDYKVNVRNQRKLMDSFLLFPIEDIKNFDRNFELSAINSEEFAGYISKFVDVTRDKFSFKNLDEKLRTLQLSVMPIFSSYILGINGEYDIEKHKIRVSRNIDLSIYHELFHAMSSYRLSNKIFGCGFFQNNGGLLVGAMLDEGYTDLLSARYFDSSIAYNISANLALKLETIIGKEQMEFMYSTNDLVNVINFLADYSSLFSAFKFLSLLDKLKSSYKVGAKSINILNIISDYLVNIYIELLSEEYLNGKTSQYDVINKLSYFRERFVDYVFDSKFDEKSYISSLDYIDITSKLSKEEFQKTLKTKVM